MAVLKGDSKLISLLLHYGADVNQSNKFSAGHIPLTMQDSLTTDLLINGGSLLMLACAMEHASAVKVLLKAGSNRNASIVGKQGTHTAMSIAKKRENTAIINLLVQNFNN